MIFKYQCKNLSGQDKEKWMGNVKVLKMNSFSYELKVEARGSCFHLIIGNYSSGKYLCIPNWNIGLDMGELTDRYWNWERLKKTGMKSVDSSSVAYALYAFSDYMAKIECEEQDKKV